MLRFSVLMFVLSCAAGALACTATGVTWQLATSGTTDNNELVSLVMLPTGAFQMYAKSSIVDDSTSCCTGTSTGTWAAADALDITFAILDCSLSGTQCATQSCPQSQSTMDGVFNTNCSALTLTIPGVSGALIMTPGTTQAQCTSVTLWISHHHILLLACGIGAPVLIIACMAVCIYRCRSAKPAPPPLRYEPI